MYDITFHEPSWAGHVEGYTKDTVIDSLFHRTFREYEYRKMLESKKLPSNRTEDDLSATALTWAVDGLPSNRTQDDTQKS